jgi:hypothetical protein
MTAFLRPTDPGYDDEVAGYNRLVVHRPEHVMAARSVDDVVEAADRVRAIDVVTADGQVPPSPPTTTCSAPCSGAAARSGW